MVDIGRGENMLCNCNVTGGHEWGETLMGGDIAPFDSDMRGEDVACGDDVPCNGNVVGEMLLADIEGGDIMP